VSVIVRWSTTIRQSRLTIERRSPCRYLGKRQSPIAQTASRSLFVFVRRALKRIETDRRIHSDRIDRLEFLPRILQSRAILLSFRDSREKEVSSAGRISAERISSRDRARRSFAGRVISTHRRGCKHPQTTERRHSDNGDLPHVKYFARDTRVRSPLLAERYRAARRNRDRPLIRSNVCQRRSYPR